MKKTLKRFDRAGIKYNLLGLPESKVFKIELVSMMGANIERAYNKQYNKNVYGISHLVEHLAFRSPKDYTTEELMKHLKNDGAYNASTDYDRINYWFKTSMENVDLGINLLCNFAFNSLEKIHEDEFLIEKKVVYNEAKQYADDDQTMFWFDTTGALCEYEKNDNIISSPAIIDTFTLEDCKRIKRILLSSAKSIFNITYDSSILTAEEIISKIEFEMARFKDDTRVPKINIPSYTYTTFIRDPKYLTVKLDNESEQHMTMMNFDLFNNISDKSINVVTAKAANIFLNTLSESSLSELIREKHGLTYTTHLYTTIIGYKTYTQFGCDVTKGTQDFMDELFVKSITESRNNFNTTAFESLMKTARLKRALRLLDLNEYEYWLDLATWYPKVIDSLNYLQESDLDASYNKLDELFVTEELILNYINELKLLIDNNLYGKVTN